MRQVRVVNRLPVVDKEEPQQVEVRQHARQQSEGEQSPPLARTDVAPAEQRGRGEIPGREMGEEHG